MHRKGIYIPDIPEKCDYTWEGTESRSEKKVEARLELVEKRPAPLEASSEKKYTND